MSLIIKGLDMPKNCFQCSFNDGIFCALIDNDTDAFIKNNPTEQSTKVLDNCPLIEIPTPHGRIVDYDRIFKNCTDIFEECNTRWSTPRVIIEAEE